MSKYKIVGNDSGHHFPMGEIVTKLANDSDEFKQFMLVADACGMTQFVLESGAGAYTDSQGQFQMLKAVDVEAV